MALVEHREGKGLEIHIDLTISNIVPTLDKCPLDKSPFFAISPLKYKEVTAQTIKPGPTHIIFLLPCKVYFTRHYDLIFFPTPIY